MTDVQRTAVRAAMFEARLSNERVNNAMVSGDLSGLIGDRSIADFVWMLKKAPTSAAYQGSIDALLVALGSPAAPTSPGPQTPQPDTGITFTAPEIQLLGDLNFSARAALGHTGSIVDRLLVLAAALKAGLWRQWQDVDRDYIVDLMGSTSDGIYPANRTVLEKFASAIGVHVDTISIPTIQPAPTAPAPTPPTPVVVNVPEQVPVTDATTAQVIAALASLGIHVRKNKLSIGMLPIANDPSGLQIGGDASACILGMSNAFPDGTPRGTDRQNPGEAHINTFTVADGDGGMRWRQYLQWVTDGLGNMVRKRNTTNRPAGTLALDSMNDLCAARLNIGADSDGGQSWYIRIRGDGIVEFCTYKIGKFIRILRSLFTYSDTEGVQL